MFSPDAKDSVSISDLRLFLSVSASDLSISPLILLANDLESWSLPLTDGLSSRILPSESEPIEMVLSFQMLTRLVVDFLWMICWAIILTLCYCFENYIAVKEKT